MGKDENGQTVSLPDPATMLKVKTQLAVNRLLATYLSILEEVADDHDAAMDKLRAALPANYNGFVDLAECLPDAKFETLRRRVLKVGNDARREIEETIDSLRLTK